MIWMGFFGKFFLQNVLLFLCSSTVVFLCSVLARARFMYDLARCYRSLRGKDVAQNKVICQGNG